jgi:molybdopterin/thiamine biosynthesis adenylyltransferase
MLNREFFDALAGESLSSEIAFDFYLSGNTLFCANSVIDDMLQGEWSDFFPLKFAGSIKSAPPGDYELAGLESTPDGIVRWIIPESYAGLFEIPDTDADLMQQIVDALSTDSKIIINGTIYESPGIICEFNGRRFASPVHVADLWGIDSRTLLWLGKGNFEKINSASICCIGAGGVMNPFVVQAVHHGFRRFTIIDSDRLEPHNLNRFIGASLSDEGRYKTEILKDYIMKLRPDAEVVTVNAMFPEGESVNAMAGCDLVVAGVDNNYTRILVQLYALAMNRAFFDMGSGIFLEDNDAEVPVVDERGGQVRFLSPGGPCLACMGVDPAVVKNRARMELEERRGYIAGTELTPPSVVTLNFAVSSICLNMAVEYVTTGRLEDNHVHYDDGGRRIIKIREVRRDGCTVCGGGG